jgi:Tfp pilus assembly protein PilF
MGYYQEAIAVDPGYALAYAGMAETYAVAASWAYMPTGEVCAQARAAAEKAVSIDPALSAAHAVLGLIAEVCDWAWEEAERHLKRAIELGPGVAINHQWYAQLLAATGRHSEAAAEARIASEYDPRSASVNGAAGLVLGCNGEYREAIALFDKVRAFEAESAPLYFYESVVLYRMGEEVNSARALIRYLEIVAETDRDRDAVAALRDALDTRGIAAYNEAVLAFSRARDAERSLSAYYIAICFARTDEADSAMVWLERSYRRREGSLHALLTGGGSFTALHSDPRFIDLVGRMGLPAPKRSN